MKLTLASMQVGIFRDHSFLMCTHRLGRYDDSYFVSLLNGWLQMLIAFAGYVSGYNGSFEFKEPGVSYEDYPYYGMRLVSVALEVILITKCSFIQCMISVVMAKY